jgi:hypothetical protein
MEELLRTIIGQNETLIALGERQAAALEKIRKDLDGIQATLITNDSSSEVSSISIKLDDVVDKLEDLLDKEG